MTTLIPDPDPRPAPPASETLKLADVLPKGHHWTDVELREQLPKLTIEQQIEVVLGKFVGGAVSKFHDGETNALKADRQIGRELLGRLRKFGVLDALRAEAASPPAQEPDYVVNRGRASVTEPVCADWSALRAEPPPAPPAKAKLIARLRKLDRDATSHVGGSGGRYQCVYCLRESFSEKNGGPPEHHDGCLVFTLRDAVAVLGEAEREAASPPRSLYPKVEDDGPTLDRVSPEDVEKALGAVRVDDPRRSPVRSTHPETPSTVTDLLRRARFYVSTVPTHPPYGEDARHLLAEIDAALPAPSSSPTGWQDMETPERTLRSIAAMLGWMNVPPRHIFEAEIRALKDRASSSPKEP